MNEKVNEIERIDMILPGEFSERALFRSAEEAVIDYFKIIIEDKDEDNEYMPGLSLVENLSKYNICKHEHSIIVVKYHDYYLFGVEMGCSTGHGQLHRSDCYDNSDNDFDFSEFENCCKLELTEDDDRYYIEEIENNYADCY